MKKNRFFNEKYIYSALISTVVTTIAGIIFIPEIHPLAIYALTINIIAFIVYGLDKGFAQSKHSDRIPEKHLLLLGLLGGTIGSLLAMRYLRHKSQKASYQIKLGVVLLLQIALAYVILSL